MFILPVLSVFCCCCFFGSVLFVYLFAFCLPVLSTCCFYFFTCLSCLFCLSSVVVFLFLFCFCFFVVVVVVVWGGCCCFVCLFLLAYSICLLSVRLPVCLLVYCVHAGIAFAHVFIKLNTTTILFWRPHSCQVARYELFLCNLCQTKPCHSTSL